MALHKSGEDYLKTILRLEERDGCVRSIDIAAEFGYSKPSISRAISILKKDGYVTMEEDHAIRLTEKGRQKADELRRWHNAIARYFVEVLGVSRFVAEEDACRIEHVISKETMEKIIMYPDHHGKQAL
jgi:Mn-dependent DtxR family transcriptional regulator